MEECLHKQMYLIFCSKVDQPEVITQDPEEKPGKLLQCFSNMTANCQHRITLSLPRVIKFKFPLQPHQKYDITQYEEVGFS